MNIPPHLKYTAEHEWLAHEDGLTRIGITDYAQDQLGDIVYVELPKPGSQVAYMQPFGVVESVKSASDLFAPVSGEVIEANARLEEEPELVNTDPYGEGWMIRVWMTDETELDRLLSAEAYAELTAAG